MLEKTDLVYMLAIKVKETLNQRYGTLKCGYLQYCTLPLDFFSLAFIIFYLLSILHFFILIFAGLGEWEGYIGIQGDSLLISIFLSLLSSFSILNLCLCGTFHEQLVKSPLRCSMPLTEHHRLQFHPLCSLSLSKYLSLPFLFSSLFPSNRATSLASSVGMVLAFFSLFL